MATRAIPAKKIEAIQTALSSGKFKNNQDIAKKFGVSTGTVSNIKNNLMNPEDRIRALNTRLKDALACLDSTRRQRDTFKEELDTLLSFSALAEQCIPDNMSIRKRPKKHEAMPILMLSDWHIDEVIDPRALNFQNEFNITIAKHRIREMFNYAAKLIQIFRKDSDITRLIIALLGDLMSAWIHDELVETNSMPPADAVLELIELLVGGISFLLDRCELEEIIIVGAVGNHGRLTKRIQAKRRVHKSYEWIIYNMVARIFREKNESRVKFKMPAGYFNWLDVFGFPIRFSHGDAVRYNGGVGGIHIPLRKAIAQWNKFQHAYLDLLAHWHTLEWSRDYVINGSLIGYSEYAETIKADPDLAQQAIFLLHSKFGKTGQYPIVLQDPCRSPEA